MKVCIVVHSKTGNTFEYAKVIESKLKEKKHVVELVRLDIDPPDWQGRPKDGKEFSINNLPDCSGYDIVMIGSPVWGASATPVIMKAVAEMKGLSGKKVMPFTTQAFAFSFLGGNRTMGMISKEAQKKGATVLPGKNIPKMFRNVEKLRETNATEMVSRL